MKADAKRKPGFYWVRLNGTKIVAEFIAADFWRIAGSGMSLRESELHVLSARLEPPKPASVRDKAAALLAQKPRRL